mgnify:CR=1 FL=1
MFCRARTIVALVASVVATTLVMPSHGAHASERSRHRVVIVGDSVFSVLRWAPASQVPLWRHGYDVVNEAWGCQTFMTAGCPGSGNKSTLQRLADHRTEKIDAIIVGTGYNDVGTSTVRTAMKKIVAFASARDIPVFWATYFEGGNMERKAREFNRVVRAEASHHPSVTVLEWNDRAAGHRNWFNGDSVHLNRAGGRQLGRFLASALDDYFSTAGGG